MRLGIVRLKVTTSVDNVNGIIRHDLDNCKTQNYKSKVVGLQRSWRNRWKPVFVHEIPNNCLRCRHMFAQQILEHSNDNIIIISWLFLGNSGASRCVCKFPKSCKACKTVSRIWIRVNTIDNSTLHRRVIWLFHTVRVNLSLQSLLPHNQWKYPAAFTSTSLSVLSSAATCFTTDATAGLLWYRWKAHS